MSSRDLRLKSRVQLLQASPLFVDLHAEELMLLSELCQEVAVGPGEDICTVNEPGDCLFVVESGVVEIVHEDGPTQESAGVIAKLGRGEFFGEMSMLEKSTRSATVRACESVRLLVLTTDDLYSFAKIFRNGFTVVVINIARTLSQRLRNTTLRLRQHS